MKKVSTIFSCCFIFFLFGLPLSTFSQPDNTALGDVQVKSPEVSAISKFIEASNNHFTGAAGVSIPIEVLEEGNLQLPISLNYHASGIRTGEAASRVGLGFSLNTTFLIQRTILGIEDERTNGYLNTNYDYTDPLIVENVGLGLFDGEPDLWTYSLPGGMSGKFIINKSTNDIVQYPRTDNKIIVSSDLEEFTIITPDGTKYYFGQVGNDNFDGYIQVGEFPFAIAGTGIVRQHVEWYLRQIKSFDDNYEINFTYEQRDYFLLSPASEQYAEVYSNRTTSDPKFLEAEQDFGMDTESVGSFNVLPANNGRTNLPLFASAQAFETKEIRTITTSTTRVDFIDGPNKRQDLDAFPYSDSEIVNNAIRPEYKSYPLGQIRISGIGGSPYCKQFNFSYDYFKAVANPIYSFDVRLKLNQVQEVTCNGTGESVNPYVFDYYTEDQLNYDFLPFRLTKAKDGYGFYNGQTGNNELKFNFPAATLSVSNGGEAIVRSKGAAKRQTVFGPMLYGTLKSVLYPEKGTNEFVYQANSIKKITFDTTEVDASRAYSPFANCPLNSSSGTVCCPTMTTTKIYNFDQEFIDSSLIRIYLQNVGCMVEPDTSYNGFVRLAIRDMTTDQLVGERIDENSMSLIDSVTIDIKANYNLVAGRDYQFEMETTDLRGFLFFRKKRITATASNELVGGLRIAEQHSYDRNDNLLTSRYYDYSLPNEPTISSGVVYKKPIFALVVAGDEVTAVGNNGLTINSFFAKLSWNSTPRVSLSDLQGYHIGYQNVREYQTNGAFTDYVFQTRTLDVANGNTILPYPFAPFRYFFDNGKVQQIESGGQTGGNELVVQHQGFQAGPLLQTITANPSLRVEAQSGSAGDLYLTNRFNWQNTGFYEAFRDTNIVDGVKTITAYDYASFPRDHLQPTEMTMTNSDGEVTTNKTRFAHEIVADGDLPNQAVYQEMIDRNMIGIPIEQTRLVDDTLVSGTRSKFNIFFDDPYLDSVFTYETTWDTFGIEQITGWELLGHVAEYHDFGKPKRIIRNHWNNMSLEYHPVHRLLTQKRYVDYRWNYEYHDGSRLIKRITDIDRQYTDFEWDGLARLDSIKSRLGAVKTGFTYNYALQDPARPQTYVKQQTVYTPVDGSALTSQTTWTYFDDLSRPYQTVQQQYSGENAFDVVTGTEYDDYSRPIKQYEPFEVIDSTHGFAVAVPASTPFTETTYEETPLNRPLTTTPPDWYATTFAYGPNTAADMVLNLRTDVAYPEGELMKETVIDPNGNKSIVFKDKLGLPVLSRQAGSTSSDRADTYNLYDAKRRPSIIVPPEATLTTTPNLLYKTFYDGANNPILKQIPDMEIMEMLYNNRDLMVAKRGGNLRKDGKWMVTTYDQYPRVVQTGLITETGQPNPETVVPTEVWTESYYGGDTPSGSLNPPNPDIYIGKLSAKETFVLNGNQLTGERILRTMRYNDYGQLTQELGSNHYAGSRLWKFFTYDFADNLLRQERRFHTTDIFRERRDTLINTYDHQGRLLDSYHAMRNEDRQQLCHLDYTPKDELKRKFLGGTTNGFLQEVNYTYRTNRFLEGINPTLTGNDLFSLNINYDQAVTSLTPQTQRNGNITQLTWQVQGKPSQTYGYTYDFLDRLTEARYGANNNAYGTTYSYDLRGNFTNITRRGVYSDGNGFQPQSIDVMNFTPVNGSNKMKQIADSAPCPANKNIQAALDNTQMHAVDGIILASNTVNPNADITYQAGTSVTLQAGFTAKPGTDFTAKIGDCPQSGYETDGFVQRSGDNIEYDCEGNRTRDPNKGITVAFNYLNQPYQVTWDNGNRVNWLYDGAGAKLQKQTTGKHLEQVVVNGDTLFQLVDTTLLKLDYVDGSGIEYEQDTLARIYADDARVNFASDTLTNYSYFLKDHLMSTRVVFEEDNGAAQLISEHHQYPFGLAFKGEFATNNATKRLYNFKEQISDFGLGWLDFGVRYYLGGAEPVFLTVDPISEDFAFISGYNYAENKVPNAIDLYGLQAEHFANVWFQMRDRLVEEKGSSAGAAVDEVLLQGGLISIGAAGGAIGLAEIGGVAYTYALLNPVTTTNSISVAGAFTVGVLDEAGQVQLPGPVDDAGRATKLAGNKFIKQLLADNPVIDLMGGPTSKIAGALNVDKQATRGIKGSVDDFINFARQEGITGTINEITANNPQAKFLSQAAELLESGGTLTVRGQLANRYFKNVFNGKASGIENFDVVSKRTGLSTKGFSRTDNTPLQGEGNLNEIVLKRR